MYLILCCSILLFNLILFFENFYYFYNYNLNKLLLSILFGLTMKHKLASEVCFICKENFVPDPRVGDRQKVCKKLSSKLQRKKLAQQNWLSKNPGYFRGRYPQLKDQILANKKQKVQSKPPACFSIHIGAYGSNQEIGITIKNNLQQIMSIINLKNSNHY